MSSAHTPGPWQVGQNNVEVFGADLTHVASGFTGDEVGAFNRDRCMANARLIAAAPDLLAVVKELEESAGYWGEYDVPVGIVDRLRAAIFKATWVKA